METTIKEKDDDRGDENTTSRGSKKSVTKRLVPGVLPTLYGQHLMSQVIFLGLDDVASNLPTYEERFVPVAMDSDLACEYKRVEDALRDAIKEMMAKSHGSDRRLLGPMLTTLLLYPDHPFGWAPVGYKEANGGFVQVVDPIDLGEQIRPKERKLAEICMANKKEGRQVWVFVQYTGEKDVQSRLEAQLKQQGLTVKVLKSSVSPEKREAWIAKNARGVDVVISHPELVKTGLDLFDKKGAHNFPSLVFYETGYNLFTLRQASRRAWRIGQKAECRVYFLYYDDTVQARAINLMAKKMAASQAVEGKFSTEGLAAMAGDDDNGSMESALARNLTENMKCDDLRKWSRIAHSTADQPVELAEIVHNQPTEEEVMSGDEIIASMKQHKVTIPELAARLGVSKYRVSCARKNGVPVASRKAWTDAIKGGGDKPKERNSPRSSSKGRGRVGAKKTKRPG